MPRLLPRRARSHAQLRDQLLRQLENEAEKILRRMTEDFTRSLAGEVEKTLKSTLDKSSPTSLSLANVNSLITTAVSFFASKPRTTRSTRESDRSRAMADAFRLSRAQSAAEAGMALSKANKNT